MKSFLRCLLFLFLSVSAVAQPGWHWQNPLPTGADLAGIISFDVNTYTAVGTGGTIYRTTDGGLTWNERPVLTAGKLHAIAKLSANTAVAVGAVYHSKKTS
jgi:photosystem II stability/assembly factor-like uncharacterized protein